MSKNLVFITGASQGFGKELALVIARSYMVKGPTEVVLAARSIKNSEQTKTEFKGINSSSDITISAVYLNYESESLENDIGDMLAKLGTQYNHIYLFNNAGTLGKLDHVRNLSYQDIVSNVQINLTGPLFMTGKFLDKYDQKSKITVVNVSSLAAIQPFDTWGMYCATKAARNMYHRNIALEEDLLKKQVRVLNYAPGPLDTAMQQRIRQEMPDVELKKAFTNMHEKNNLVQPRDSAQALITLLEKNEYVNGAHVDYFELEQHLDKTHHEQELTLVNKYLTKGINVVDRPTTQQGLGGIRMKVQGPGRMVQDKTYFQTELRQKLNAITEEIYRLNTELDATNKENTELRDLQGQLGDLNTLVDKLNTDTDLEEFEREHNQLLAKNHRTNEMLDEIFLQRKQRESAIQDVEQQILEEEKKCEDQINALEPEKRQEYAKLKNENIDFLQKIISQQQDLDKLNAKAQALKDEVSRDPLKEKALTLYQRFAEIKERKRELEASLKASELESGPQERARLLEQVKSDNLETSGMERKLQEMEEETRLLKEKLGQDSAQDPAQAEKLAKYEELLKKDEEMQQFLNSFDSKKQEAINRNETTESTILEVLHRVQGYSKHDLHNLPSRQEFKELNSDLAAKQNEVTNAENTSEALLLERDQRMQDLEKVGQLEVKLSTELGHLTERIETLKQSLETFGNLDQLKKEMQDSQAKKSELKKELQIKKSSLAEEISSLVAIHEAKRAQLLENETYTQLGLLEQRLRHYEGIAFDSRDFIASKTAESDYKPLAKEVLALMDQVNAQVIKILQMAPAR
ncbi:Intraflagellar transport protein 74 [Terramyces sp. JEL0728]|nr:Intraflagellar transport protein 74 [Terramyces sp. JEL0728]